jgi:hypothetical protein
MRILKRLFSPEEGRLVIHLTYKPAPIKHIYELAKGSGIASGSVESMLNNMAKNSARESIIRHGALLVHCKGYNNTGLSEILKAAGVPKGSFYFYFKSKDLQAHGF